MYLLERIEADSDRLIHASPDRTSVDRVLSLILRSRGLSINNPVANEHFRAAQYRLKFGEGFDDFITLDGEHFRIREDQTTAIGPPNKLRSLRRIAKSVSAPSSIAQPKDAVAVAVERAFQLVFEELVVRSATEPRTRGFSMTTMVHPGSLAKGSRSDVEIG